MIDEVRLGEGRNHEQRLTRSITAAALRVGSVDTRQNRLAGAALADVEGRVLGMYVSGGPRERRVVLPAETLARVASELLAHGRVRRGYLGVGTQPVRLQGQARAAGGQETGLLVLSVEPGGPSDAAGLALGDVLLSLDGTAMEDVHDLLARLAHDAVGQSLPLKLLRGGKVEERTVAVGVRP